ncbi:hypothetical protein Pmani_022369 [Petrolisthes manimaculis]|uniref:Uncharacterized protein n=1 Tax=Petrolisthes manimaculis TaxID=1843537 RepID=A0AAE1PE22_9EUCA|nr:hypothetical protein Pmani_022369 [Petrolisthes manimaculis]
MRGHAGLVRHARWNFSQNSDVVVHIGIIAVALAATTMPTALCLLWVISGFSQGDSCQKMITINKKQSKCETTPQSHSDNWKLFCPGLCLGAEHWHQDLTGRGMSDEK